MKQLVFLIILLSVYFTSSAFSQENNLLGTYYKDAPTCLNPNFGLLTVSYHFNLNSTSSNDTYVWNSVSTVQFYSDGGCTNNTTPSIPSVLIEKYGTFTILNVDDSTDNNTETKRYTLALFTERQVITPLSADFVSTLQTSNCGGFEPNATSATAEHPFIWRIGAPTDVSEGCVLVDNSNSNSTTQDKFIGLDSINPYVSGSCRYITIVAQVVFSNDNQTQLFIPYINILNKPNQDQHSDVKLICSTDTYQDLPSVGANRTHTTLPTLTSVWASTCDSQQNITEIFYFTEYFWNVQRTFYSDSSCQDTKYVTSVKGNYSLSESSNGSNDTFVASFNTTEQSIIVFDPSQSLSCVSNDANDGLIPVDIGENGCSDLNIPPVGSCNDKSFENTVVISEDSIQLIAPDLLCSNSGNSSNSTVSNVSYNKENITSVTSNELFDRTPWTSNCSTSYLYDRVLQFSQDNIFTETVNLYPNDSCAQSYIKISRTGPFFFTGISFIVPAAIDTIYQIYSQSVTPLTQDALDFLNNATDCGSNSSQWELNVQRTFNNDEGCSLLNLYPISNCTFQFGLNALVNTLAEVNNSTNATFATEVLYTSERWKNNFNDCVSNGLRPQALGRNYLTGSENQNQPSSSTVNTFEEATNGASRASTYITASVMFTIIAVIFFFL